MKIVKKVWGIEEIICNNELYCCKIMYLNEGYQCSLHYHKLKDETFYILDGIVELEHNDDVKTLSVGDSVRIKPNDKHRFSGIVDSKILEISTTDKVEDSYRILPSCRIK